MSTIELVVNDITTLDVDAIVNAANSALSGGGGVDGAIHRAAGPQLREACRKLGRCPTGNAVLTPGFALKARFVIHAVGPVWSGGNASEAEQLAQTYSSALRIASDSAHISSIAFPSISTGAYKFPKRLAAKIALAALYRHKLNLDRIVVCLFDAADLKIYERVAASSGITCSAPNSSS